MRRAPEDVEQVLPRACPIVGSFGARDRWPGMRTAPDRIETALTAGNIDHDIKRCPHAGHGFMNDHKPAELSLPDKVIAKLVGARYDEPSSSGARTRIIAFFSLILSPPPSVVRYLNAHGPGTQQCDTAEIALLEQVFAARPQIYSMRPLAGHCQGAAAAVEIAAAALGYRTASYQPLPPSPKAIRGYSMDPQP